MSPLDVRAAESAIGPGQARSASRRQDDAPGFNDAFAAAGEGKPAKKRDDAAAAGERSSRSDNRLSWDPRLQETAVAADVDDQVIAAASKGAVHGGAGAAKASGNARLTSAGNDETAVENSDDQDGRPGETKPDAVVVPVTTLLPNLDAAPPSAHKADAAGGLGAGLAASSTGPRPTQGQPEAAERQQGQRREPVLVTRIDSGRPKDGPSPLAVLGSRLMRLGDAAMPDDGKTMTEAARTQDTKDTAAGSDAKAVHDLPEIGDRPASATRMDPAAVPVAVRLPGPAPAAGPNAPLIANAILASPPWAPAPAADPATARTASQSTPANGIKIQLHPAELGMVTATLQLSGDRLVINLTVETAAAYRQLSADNHAIVDKLKGHGYVVESVAVHHAAVDRSPAPQAQQAGAFASPQPGGERMAGDGRPFGRGERGGSGGRQPSAAEEQSGVRDSSAVPAAGRRPGGLYL